MATLYAMTEKQWEDLILNADHTVLKIIQDIVAEHNRIQNLGKKGTQVPSKRKASPIATPEGSETPHNYNQEERVM